MKKTVIKILLAPVVFFAVTFTIYWFNLDTKVVKSVEKPMMKHYDNLKRDRRL